jgi:hypothetical protein
MQTNYKFVKLRGDFFKREPNVRNVRNVMYVYYRAIAILVNLICAV